MAIGHDTMVEASLPNAIVDRGHGRKGSAGVWGRSGSIEAVVRMASKLARALKPSCDF
jgi:hypothetical protein